MAGETASTEAVCLAIRPWSQTSHVVAWLTPSGVLTSVVKGAVRPKSAFLGQYDLNYTCEILYYAHAKGELHALRECVPLKRRDALRADYRALALSDWYRRLAHDLAPAGPESAGWFALLTAALDALPATQDEVGRLAGLLAYELAVLGLTGLAPEFAEAEDGAITLRGERRIPVSAEVRDCLKNPLAEKNPKILLDAARVIGVFYAFHLDCATEVRRTVLMMISNNERRKKEQ